MIDQQGTPNEELNREFNLSPRAPVGAKNSFFKPSNLSLSLNYNILNLGITFFKILCFRILCLIRFPNLDDRQREKKVSLQAGICPIFLNSVALLILEMIEYCSL